jgi:histidine ammonia-lyase
VKFRSIAENAESLVAIELMAGAEALEHRRPLKAGTAVERAYATVRKYAGPLLEDRALAPDIANIALAIRAGEFDSEYEKL